MGGGAGWRSCGTYDLLVLEMAVDITAALILCDWRLPAGWIWATVRDVGRRCPSREEPDIDIRARPLRRNDAAANVVEIGAVRLGILVLDAASSICTLAWRINVTISIAQGTGEAAVIGDSAAITCVQRHRVVSCVINAFNDVDFAFVGPIGTEKPISMRCQLCLFESTGISSSQAGQVPQTPPGMCARSRMNKP